MIDYRFVRNEFRRLLIKDADVPARVGNLLDANQFAAEGRSFTPSVNLYVEEVTGIDNDGLEFSHSSLTKVTISYNVKGLLSATENMQKEIESLRLAIANEFDSKEPFELSGLGFAIMEVTRRPSTNKDGWRLAPLDVTVDCYLRPS